MCHPSTGILLAGLEAKRPKSQEFSCWYPTNSSSCTYPALCSAIRGNMVNFGKLFHVERAAGLVIAKLYLVGLQGTKISGCEDSNKVRLLLTCF